MPARARDLFGAIASFPALRGAALRAGKGKRSKPGVAAFLANLETEVLRLERELETGRYRPGRYTVIEVFDPPAVLEVLLAAGADPNAPDDSGATPIFGANPTAMRILLEAGADADARAAGFTPLHGHAQGGPSAVELLLAAGAEVNARTDLSGGSVIPLHYAAANTDSAVVIDLLLAAGADLEARDRYGATPLYYAAERNGNPTIIKALLAAGLNVNARDADGDTPLHEAARFTGWDEQDPWYDPEYVPEGAYGTAVAEALLAAGANVAARNHKSLTPLLEAGDSNPNSAVIQLLLAAAGADLKALVEDGRTLFDAARDGDAHAGVELLFAAGEDGPTLLGAMLPDEQLVAVEQLLAAGIDVNARNTAGRTLLHVAARNEDPQVIGLLLAAGADVNARDAEGNTPLHEAAMLSGWSGAPEYDPEGPGRIGTAGIEALLAADASVAVRNESGWTPLHGAVQFNHNPAVVELLLAAGADVNEKDETGRTPFDYVASRPAPIRAALLQVLRP